VPEAGLACVLAPSQRSSSPPPRSVVSALDVRTSKRVAIKKVADAFRDLTDGLRCLREIRVLRHMRDHENILQILDLDRDPQGGGGSPPQAVRDLYIVTDLFDMDLHRLIVSRQPLSREHIRWFVYQLLRGLKYLHSAGIMHRDLKPANLLLNADCTLAVCDFGLARGYHESVETSAAQMTEYVVTRWYRAPEVMLSTSQYGPPVDMWSVGCILAEMLRGQANEAQPVMFPGGDYLHQLELIFDACGTPSSEDVAFVDRRAKAFLDRQGVKQKRDWRTLFPDADSDALSLLDGLLTLSPARRLTVCGALAHPFFAGLHDEALEPSCDIPFDAADFEEEEVGRARLEALVLQQLRDFHPQD
jgi:serine/threonine protein kinase